MANKTKKMTNKEFKEALTTCGFDFDIWGYDGILNLVIMSQRLQADKDQKNGYPTLAKCEYERADALQDLLRARGFYNFD